jgi:hypothetical protein
MGIKIFAQMLNPYNGNSNTRNMRSPVDDGSDRASQHSVNIFPNGAKI